MAADWRLVGYLAVQGLVAAGSFALPPSAGGAVRLSVAAAGMLVLVAAIIWRRPARPTGWWMIALSGALPIAAAVMVAGMYGLGSGEVLRSVSQFVLAIVAIGLAILFKVSV